MRRPHPRYRSSGVEWLGDVPEHWQEGMLRRWFTIVNGGTPASTEESYWDGETVWLTPDDLGQNEGAWINSGRRTITDEGVYNSSARVSPAGSLVLSTRAPIGHLAITTVPAATNQGCRTLIPDRNTDSTFGYYMLLASRSVLQSLGKGSTFMELTPIDLGGLQIALPPLSEQRTIAEYLDRETERIDALVAKVRLLIERLQEYRAALVTRTVTSGLPPEAARAAGLDPSPRLKPSGVEWLGDVPEHWQEGALRRWFTIVNGGTPASSEESYWDGETAWLTPDDLGQNEGAWISSGRRTITEEGVLNSSARVSRAGSLVLSTRAPIGHLAIMTVPAATNQGCRTLVPDTNTDSTFGYYMLLASRPVLQSLGRGSTFMEVTPIDLGGLQISLPPLDEQRAIAEYLDQETERIDALVAKMRVLMERLKEQRAALITAAVTGKVDVREPVAVERS